MRHGSGAPLLRRQAGLGAIERLDLALLVERQDDGVGGRFDVERDDVTQLVENFGSVESLKCRTRWGARQMRWTELTLMPAASAIMAPVQWVASSGRSVRVSVTTRLATSSSSRLIREGGVLSCRSPS
jgi:hypothetical protein